MYFTSLPDHRMPGFDEQKHFGRFGKTNVIFNARSSSSECNKHVGCFSVKTVLEGEETYGIDGRKLVVRPGQFLILNDDQEYSCRITGGPTRTFSIFFRKELSAGTGFIQTLRNIDPLLRGQLSNLTGSLDHNGYQPDQVDEQLVFIVQSLLLVHGNDIVVSKNVHGIKASTRKEIYKRLCVARDFMISSYGDHLDLEAIGRVSGLSVPQLVKQFKTVFGTTPHRYLKSIRLERAAELLRSNGSSVSEIAIQCGFENTSAFCRAFKMKFGVTPTLLPSRP